VYYLPEGQKIFPPIPAPMLWRNLLQVIEIEGQMGVFAVMRSAFEHGTWSAYILLGV
jgi:hypothetical protein